MGPQFELVKLKFCSEFCIFVDLLLCPFYWSYRPQTALAELQNEKKKKKIQYKVQQILPQTEDRITALLCISEWGHLFCTHHLLGL